VFAAARASQVPGGRWGGGERGGNGRRGGGGEGRGGEEADEEVGMRKGRGKK